MGFIYVFLSGRREGSSPGQTASRPLKLPSNILLGDHAPLPGKFSVVTRRGRRRILCLWKPGFGLQSGQRFEEKATQTTPSACTHAGSGGWGEGASHAPAPGKAGAGPQPGESRCSSHSSRKALASAGTTRWPRPRPSEVEAKLKSAPAASLSVLSAEAPSGPRMCPAVDADTRSGAAAAGHGTRRSDGSPPPAPPWTRGRAPGTVTHSRVRSTSVCFSCELVHLYLLL